MKQRLALFALFLFTSPPQAQSPADTEKRLAADLKFLTSDECEGRGVGTKGLEMAAEYIERQFINAGLSPGGVSGSYYQPFQIIKEVKRGPGNRMALKGPLGQTVMLEPDRHFITMALSANGKVEAPVVFAGYGITSTNPSYDDYAGIDVAGKVVLVLSGTPRLGHKYADVFADADVDSGIEARIENAMRHKAAGLVFVNRSSPRGDPLSRLGPREGDTHPLPVAQMHRHLADLLFAGTGSLMLGDIEKQIDTDLKPRSLPLVGWTCRLETEVAITKVTVKNVVGVLEGKGPLAHETVVIGAHYDHVGYFGTVSSAFNKPTGFSSPGGVGGAGFPLAQLLVSGIHHGADDNASGTVTVMEAARRFGARKDRQGRRLVFMAFSAEESGLIGSFYYCRRPLFPLKDTTTMVNMDMVGRMQDDKVVVGGLGTGKPFPELMDKLNQKHHLNIVKEPAGTAPTDNTGFYLKKIPVIWFFTGFHEQYHRPTDRLETINISGLRRVADFVTDVVAEVSTLSKRPEYAKTGGLDRTKTLWSKAPATGLVVDYRPAPGGVVLEAVIPGTPAARAGLQKGDRILTLAGKTVSEPSTLLAVTRTLEPGQTVDVTFERGNARHTIKLALTRAKTGYTDPYFGFLADIAKIKDGLLVTEVPENSLGASAGLMKGDRIRAIAGKPITNPDTYGAALRALKPGHTAALTIVRDGKEQTLTVNAGRSGAPLPPASPAPQTQRQEPKPGVSPSGQPGHRHFLRRRGVWRPNSCP